MGPARYWKKHKYGINILAIHDPNEDGIKKKTIKVNQSLACYFHLYFY